MASEKFCLRWNDFESNISTAFRELREDKDFFDVTLACDEDQIQAHKVILSACSPFFRTVLKRNRHEHPLLYLKGVKFIDLVAVLNFMYHGEVNVAQEELNSFLAVAEELKVKGLTQNGGGGGDGSQRASPKPREPPERSQPAPVTPLPKKQRAAPPSQQTSQRTFHHSMQEATVEDPEVEEVAMVKSEPVGGAGVEQQVAEADYLETYDSYEGYEEEEGGYEGAMMAGGGAGMDGNKALSDLISSYLGRVDGGWQCIECGRQDSKGHLVEHVEVHHLQGVEYFCSHCNVKKHSRASLRRHVNYAHKKPTS